VTSIEKKLGIEITKAVEQIVAASHAAATKALDQAFAGCGKVSHDRSASRRSKPTIQSTRRSSEEIQKLKDAVYQSLCATPGQSMIALAKEVGTIPRKLQVPVNCLKSEGRILSVGQRKSMRYFPKNSSDSKTS